MERLPLTDLRFSSAEQSRCAQPSKRKEVQKKKEVTKRYLRNPFKCSHLKCHSFVKLAYNINDGPASVSLQFFLTKN